MHIKFHTWTVLVLSLAAGLFFSGFSTLALADGGFSKAPVYFWWNQGVVIGQSTLHRSAEGLKASIKINTGATEDDWVLTLWFMVFNTPEGCATSPCTPADLGSEAAGGDFLYGGGIITTG